MIPWIPWRGGDGSTKLSFCEAGPGSGRVARTTLRQAFILRSPPPSRPMHVQAVSVCPDPRPDGEGHQTAPTQIAWNSESRRRGCIRQSYSLSLLADFSARLAR